VRILERCVVQISLGVRVCVVVAIERITGASPRFMRPREYPNDFQARFIFLSLKFKYSLWQL
jgi:hypothetical protein